MVLENVYVIDCGECLGTEQITEKSSFLLLMVLENSSNFVLSHGESQHMSKWLDAQYDISSFRCHVRCVMS